MAEDFLETIRSVHAALEDLSDQISSKNNALDTIAAKITTLEAISADILHIKNQLIELQKKIG